MFCSRSSTQAFQKPCLLLLLGNVQEELDDRRAVADQMLLEGDDIPQPLGPESVVHGTRWKSPTGEKIGVDAQGDHFLVVGPVTS